MKPYIPKKLPPEKINRSNEQPLFNFFSTLFTVTGLLITVYVALLFLGFLFSKTVSMEVEYNILNKNLSKIFFDHDNKKESGLTTPVNNNQLNLKKDTLTKLTNELWASAIESQPFKFSPQLIKGSLPNAFITPGAHIFVTEPLMNESQSENELSFVLCHELGHFYNRDTIRLLGGQLFIGFFHLFIGSNMSNGLPALTKMFVNSSFSRQQENEADRFALHCMNKKYGSVIGYSHFFEKIKKLDKESSGNYFSTHPLTEDRLNAMKYIIKDNNFSTDGQTIALPWPAKEKLIEDQISN